MNSTEAAKSQHIEDFQEPFIAWTHDEPNISIENEVTPIVIFADREEFNGTSGAELAGRLRRQDIKNPLIFFTTKKALTPQEKTEFYDAGGDSVVDRGDGYDSMGGGVDSILLRKIATLSRNEQTRLSSSEREEYGDDISFDARTQSFFIHGQPAILTRIRAKALRSFLKLREQSPDGMHVSSKALYNEVYDNADYVASTLAANIAKLNKELSKHGIALRAVRGISTQGYYIAHL